MQDEKIEASWHTRTGKDKGSQKAGAGIEEKDDHAYGFKARREYGSEQERVLTVDAMRCDAMRGGASGGGGARNPANARVRTCARLVVTLRRQPAPATARRIEIAAPVRTTIS